MHYVTTKSTKGRFSPIFWKLKQIPPWNVKFWMEADNSFLFIFCGKSYMLQWSWCFLLMKISLRNICGFVRREYEKRFEIHWPTYWKNVPHSLPLFQKLNIHKKNHMVALWANEHVRKAFSTSEPPTKELKEF